ncbi:MAG: DMT family transporter [Hahellaceae bacterium]|nr:DMT family transporter [Hahellaceae bacterium]MCP5168263.1 DMT family transporter [Hahellaceae bacterium]
MAGTERSIFGLLIVAMFFWGSNFNAASALAGIVPPLTAGAERFLIAALIFLILRLYHGRAESRLEGWMPMKLVALGILGVFGFNFAFFTGLQSTSALNGALIMATSPLVTTLLASVVLGGRLGIQHWLGACLGFMGVALVITGKSDTRLQFAEGDLYMIVACLCWSLYSVLCKRYAPTVPPLQLSRWNICAGAISLSLAAVLFEHPETLIPQLVPQTHLILLYMGACGSVLAYIFWLKGIQALGPGRAALFFNLVPVFTLLVGMVLGEPPQPLQLIGMVGVITGVMLGNGVFRQFGWRAV